VSSARERFAERLEEPCGYDDPVDDREIAGARVGGGAGGNRAHHHLVLLLGLGLPWLDETRPDEAEELIGLEMDCEGGPLGEDSGDGRLADPRRAGQDQDRAIAADRFLSPRAPSPW
jgi:hypothetical protein